MPFRGLHALAINSLSHIYLTISAIRMAANDLHNHSVPSTSRLLCFINKSLLPHTQRKKIKIDIHVFALRTTDV